MYNDDINNMIVYQQARYQYYSINFFYVSPPDYDVFTVHYRGLCIYHVITRIISHNIITIIVETDRYRLNRHRYTRIIIQSCPTAADG